MTPFTLADIAHAPPMPPGRHAIFAACLDRSLGDFMCRGYYAAAVKINHAGPAYLTAYWVDDRAYKAPIMAINPYIDFNIVARGSETLPLDCFLSTGDRRQLPASPLNDIVTARHARSDLILTPSMMLNADLPKFKQFPKFSIPPDDLYASISNLVNRGLNQTRWHAAVFYRLPNYQLRGPTPYRDIQHEDRWKELASHIINNLGGQVVRIGHPGMARWELGDDFIDLSRVEDDFMLQIAAVAIARFAVVTPFGPAMLPGVFNVPYAIANAVSALGVWRPDTLLLPRPIFGPGGEPVDIPGLISSGGWHDEYVSAMTRKHGYTVGDNTTEELTDLADRLYRSREAATCTKPPPLV